MADIYLSFRSTIFNSQPSTNRSQLLFTVAGHSPLCSRSWNTICFDHSGQKFGITKCFLNPSLCIFVDRLEVCDQQALKIQSEQRVDGVFKCLLIADREKMKESTNAKQSR